MTGNGVSAGPVPGLKNEKNRIREEMLKARLSVPEDVKCGADVIMTKKLLSLASFRYAGTILFYYPIKGEPDITGAVSNIRADKTNIGGASTSVDQMLSGRISGVQFKQNTSQPGGGGKTIIRGRNSLFLNTDPLYVVEHT